MKDIDEQPDAEIHRVRSARDLRIRASVSVALVTTLLVHTISVFYWAHLCMKWSLGISHFLEKISSLSHFLFSSISLHWSLRKAFLSLLAILWNSAFKWVYLSISPLLFASLLFTAICKASSDSNFAFLHFFFLEMPRECFMKRWAQ